MDSAEAIENSMNNNVPICLAGNEVSLHFYSTTILKKKERKERRREGKEGRKGKRMRKKRKLGIKTMVWKTCGSN